MMLTPRLMQKYGSQPFRIGKKAIFSHSSGFLVPKNSALKEHLDGPMHWIVSAGIVQKLQRKYFPIQALAQDTESRVSIT